jgi:uncharacterized Ntn-hydrolase superfamily protein
VLHQRGGSVDRQLTSARRPERHRIKGRVRAPLYACRFRVRGEVAEVPQPSTFSIVAVDPEAGEAGVAVQSKFLAAGAVVSWARGGVGAVATQAMAEVTFGVRGLDLLEEGIEPQAALDRLLSEDDGREHRQVGIVDMAGRSASFTGSECFDWAGGETGDGFCCQGNILAGPDVVGGMAEAYRAARMAGAPLADRLIEALRAGQGAGGDRRGQEAAGLLVVKPGGGYGGNHDRWIDLRVDHHDDPIEQLAMLLELHRLYFGRPVEAELIAVDSGLADEIRSALSSLGKLPEDVELWDALEDYMGRENLEERWAGPGRIDPRVLAYLHAYAARGE